MGIMNLGCHASAALKATQIDEMKKYTNLFQVFLQAPQRLILDKDLLRDAAYRLRDQHSDCHFVIHAPFWYNTQAPSRFHKLTLKSIRQYLEVCEEFAFSHYVIHTGSRKVTDKETGEVTIYDLQESVEFMTNALLSVAASIEGTSVKLCLENTPNVGTKGVGANQLLHVVERFRNKGLNNIGLCFDTEHAYAHGTEVTHFDRYIEFAEVIHLNSVPEKVEFGKGLDRHSKTPMSESVGIEPASLVRWAHRYADTIKILEMNQGPATETFEWLSTNDVLRIIG